MISNISNLVRKRTGRAIRDFNLIEEGDVILAAVSGGKDSLSMLRVLTILKKKAPVKFKIIPVNLDQGFPGYRSDIVEKFFISEGYTEYIMERFDIYSIVSSKTENGDMFCALCSRLRRGILYSLAIKHGCNKLALGHHMDDVLVTFFLNLFFEGRLKAMSPKFLADNGKVTVIRPLVYLKEEELAIYAKVQNLPVICCGCPVCGKRDMKRERIKKLLLSLEREYPGIRNVIFRSLSRVDKRFLLPDVVFEKKEVLFTES
jgi:tRNA 2-thiocytidine biosynthesis protein TtcA